MRTCLLLAILGLAACDPSIHDLDETSAAELRVDVRVDRADDDALQIGVLLSLPTVGNCMELGPSFGGALAGLAPTQVWRGEADYDFGCSLPQVTFLVPAARRVPDATLTVGDASRAITIPLGDRLVPRTGALVTPSDAIVHPGAPIAFTWSSAADRASGRFNGLVVTPNHELVDLPVTLRGDQITAVAPPAIPAGAGELCIDWRPDGAPQACTGATCTLDLWFDVCADVIYAP